MKENTPLGPLNLEHFVLPFAILTGGISLATLVFILELSFKKDSQNGIVKPLALENDSNTNDMLSNPDSATVLTYVEIHVPFHNQVPVHVPDHYPEYNSSPEPTALTLL